MIRFSVESSIGRDSQCSATLLHPAASRHFILFSQQHFQPVGNALFAWTAPRAVLELTKCTCRGGCTGRCNCCKNGLPCTPLCKCYGSECSNAIKNDGQVNGEVDDDDEDEF